MELVIKLYSDKPSKIGVKYIYDYLAERSYEEIISKARGERFSVTLEPVKDRMELVLKSEDSGKKFVYRALEYKNEQLQRLRNVYAAGDPLEFVHVYPKNNTLMVAKPFRQQIFVAVGSVSFINI